MTQQLEQAPKIGHYAVTKELQKDSYGILYEAKDDRSGSSLLLRVIAPEISNNENFIVRFELLKHLLPEITHRNLLKVISLESHDNIYFIIKEHHPLLTLENFDARDTPNRHRTLEALFEGLAKGLQALYQVRNSYYKTGIPFIDLTPDRIYLDFEKGLVGGSPKPVPKIDGFTESFLFYGDEPQAALRYRLAKSLFSYEHLYSSCSRDSTSSVQCNPLFGLGALIHNYLVDNHPRGVFPRIADIDPQLDSTWDTIADLCLSGGENEENPIDEIVKLFGKMTQARTQLTPQERKLKNVDIPEGMVLVTFDQKVELGASDGPLNEQPRFRARINPFFMDATPVTCAQFEEFLRSYQRSTYSPHDHSPATLISWHMAKSYCLWRAEKEGLPQDTYRLPTEYEWEAAVRGAKPRPHHIHCAQDKKRGSIPVKSMPPGHFGLYDMIGNVWEWTESIYKPHPFSEHHEKGYSAMLYVIKGGCWFTPLAACQASLREAYPPHASQGHVGFRCVRMVDLEE